MSEQGTYIDGDEQLPTFIPAPVPPVEPEYDVITDWWGESAEYHRNMAKRYEHAKAKDAYEAQMEYYNSVIVPLGNNR